MTSCLLFNQALFDYTVILTSRILTLDIIRLMQDYYYVHVGFWSRFLVLKKSHDHEFCNYVFLIAILENCISDSRQEIFFNTLYYIYMIHLKSLILIFSHNLYLHSLKMIQIFIISVKLDRKNRYLQIFRQNMKHSYVF